MTKSDELPQSSLTSAGNSDQLRRRRTFWFMAIWICVVGVIIPPMLGVVGALLGMNGAFNEMGSSGIGDPAALSGHIGKVLVSTAASVIISAIFVVMLIGVLIRFFTLPKVPGSLP